MKQTRIAVCTGSQTEARSLRGDLADCGYDVTTVAVRPELLIGQCRRLKADLLVAPLAMKQALGTNAGPAVPIVFFRRRSRDSAADAAPAINLPCTKRDLVAAIEGALPAALTHRCLRQAKRRGGPQLTAGDASAGRAEAAQDLPESEARYRALFDQAADGIMFMAVDGSSLMVNDSFARMHGYGGPAEMKGVRLEDLDTPETAKLAPERLQRMLAGETLCFEVEHCRKDGGTVPLQVSCSVVRIGEKSFFLGYHRDISERKRAERALQESEQRFIQVADNAEEWVWEVDRNGVYTFCSPVVERILGYRPDELVGKKRFDELFAPDIDEVVRIEGVNRFARRLPYKLFVNANCCKDGRRVILETNGVPFFDGQGEFIGYRGADRDITARVQAEEARRESEEKYRGLVEATDTGFVMLDTSGKVRDANAEYVRMTGHRTLDEILGRPVTDWTAPYDIARNAAEVMKCLRHGSVRMLEVDYVHGDDTIVPIEINATVIFTRSGPLIVTLCRDITTRKRAEEALRDSETRYQMLVKHAPAGIFEFDCRTGRIDNANDVMSEYTGYTRDEIIGMDPADLLDGESRALHLQRLDQAKTGGLPESVEYRIRRKDGRTIWGSFLSSYRFDGDKPVRATTVVSDITARKQVELALQESEARLRFLGDNLPGILFYQIDVGPDGRSRRFTHISGGVEKLHGITAAQALADAQRIYGQICAEQRKTVETREAAAIKAQRPFETEAKLTLPSGEVRWRQFISIPQPHPRKNLWDGIEIDITERKKAEVALREINQRFEYSLGATHTGFDIIDDRYTVVYINPEWRKTYGDPAGRKCYEYFMGRSAVCPGCGIAKALRDKVTTVTEEFLEREQRWVEVHTIPFRGESGEWLVAEFNIDINERKKAEFALRDSEQRYRLLVEQLPDAIYIYDGKRFAFANKAGVELLGAGDAGQLIGRPLTDFLHPDYRRQVDQRMASVYRKGESAPLAEQRLIRMDGGEIDINVKSIPFPYLGKHMALAIVRDITEAKRAEQGRRESEERFNKAFHNSPIVMVITDLASGRVIDINDEFTRLFRVKRDQVIGHDTLQLGLWTNRAHRRGKLRPALDRGTMRNVPLEMKTWDGRQLALLLSSETVAIGGTACLLTSAFDVTESKRVLQQLRESEERYRLLAENSNEVVWTAGFDARFTYVSPAIAHLQGYTPEEAKAIGMPGLVAPESQGMLRSLQREMRGLLRRGSVPPRAVKTATLACRHKSGGRLWCEVTTMIRTDAQGRPDGILGVTRDITKRKEAEDALRGSEDQLRTLVLNQGEGIGIVDARDRFLFANPAAEVIFGVNPGTLVGKTLRRFVAEPQYAEVRKQTAMRKSGIRSTYELDIRKQNGQHRHILVTGTPRTDPRGRFIGTFAIFRDITELRRIDQALRQSEEALRKFIEQSAEGIVILDEQGRVAEWNRAQQRIYGIGRDRTVGRPFWDLQYELTPPRQRARGQRQSYRRQVMSALRTGQSPIFDAPLPVIVTGRDGTIRHTEQRAFPIRSAGGIRIGAVTLDVTEQRRLEQQILEIGDRVQRQVGHDLHDGLSQLLTVMGLRLTALEHDQAAGRAVSRGELAALSALVKQAMSQAIGLSRGLAPMGLETSGIVPALAELARTTAAVAGIPCSATLDERIRLGDVALATHVYRIAQEAVNNAVKHARASQLEISLARERGVISLCVKDNGTGIIRRRSRTNGMGLKIMQYRARMIGATLESRPNPAGGTVVCCRFGTAAVPQAQLHQER